MIPQCRRVLPLTQFDLYGRTSLQSETETTFSQRDYDVSRRFDAVKISCFTTPSQRHIESTKMEKKDV